MALQIALNKIVQSHGKNIYSKIDILMKLLEERCIDPKYYGLMTQILKNAHMIEIINFAPSRIDKAIQNTIIEDVCRQGYPRELVSDFVHCIFVSLEVKYKIPLTTVSTIPKNTVPPIPPLQTGVINVIHKNAANGTILSQNSYKVNPGNYGAYNQLSFTGYGYGFLVSGSAPASGTIAAGETKTIIYQYTPLPPPPPPRKKSRAVAGLIGITLGSLGIHNFYLSGRRRIKLGLGQLVFSLTGLIIGNYLVNMGMIVGYLGILGLLWGYIEGLCILSGRECSYGDYDEHHLWERDHWKVIALVIHVLSCLIMFIIINSLGWIA